MGHPEPYDLRYVAIGNQDCGKKNYRGGQNFAFVAFNEYIFCSIRMMKLKTHNNSLFLLKLILGLIS